jgi:hypothetical protein
MDLVEDDESLERPERCDGLRESCRAGGVFEVEMREPAAQLRFGVLERERGLSHLSRAEDGYHLRITKEQSQLFPMTSPIEHPPFLP